MMGLDLKQTVRNLKTRIEILEETVEALRARIEASEKRESERWPVAPAPKPEDFDGPMEHDEFMRRVRREI